MLGSLPTSMPAALPAAAGPAAAAAPADGAAALAWLLVAIPLVSAGALLVAGRRADRWGHWLAVAAAASGVVVAAAIVVQLLGLPGPERVLDLHLFSWIPAGDLTVDAGLRVDPLSMTFVLLVTFVGSLIHVYSVAYMAHDADRRRFFAYLNLFVAAMLLLVLADSYALLFVGWEGVGLASYLLIGFWNHRTDYAVAAKKAFVMNRVGDVGLLVAMMTMFTVFGTVSFSGVLPAAAGASEGVLTLIGLTLLLAACGKSAQFPLQAWLGDAMAGPTPVSALIHAATMVTAGVYLVVRSGPIFTGAPTALLVVAIVGAITLVFGAVVGSAKDDIKKVLAASTMSQIGYMMLGAGLGPVGYAFAIFHLITHGFFKAGMFLGAGSVMHGMGDQVDMRRFGHLSAVMKVTWLTFLAGWLAIIGVPPFSGFWSKDRIIEAAFSGTGWQPWVFGTVALLGAGLTAFYMSRLFFMTFHGKARWTTAAEGAEVHPHEAPALMTVPMVVLAIGSLALGGLLMVGGSFATWLEPVTGAAEHVEPVLPPAVIMVATFVLVVAGALVAWRRYAVADVPVVAPAASPLTVAARHDLYQDAVNEGLFMRPSQYLTRSLVYADTAVVDGAVMGVAKATSGTGRVLSRLQNGYVRSYAGTMAAGAVLALVVVLAARV
ncbi:NADH-quinone oxidoreductase subunit L [Georgenia sp. TF02-10]|uniref:NADH-quinone oxidoreductase subunit L n=1 Tax=Georgenia sp. TF02-10 TaxID=2917725 RepID=UPI001FA6D556|nr:NADH-quinone oxidoreductase subunit L [Georgenia sp. TF02-10]UNX54409.1 NADH-quinone oxidoreductase subunit L [Georgenia sp. TF02-10]